MVTSPDGVKKKTRLLHDNQPTKESDNEENDMRQREQKINDSLPSQWCAHEQSKRQIC